MYWATVKKNERSHWMFVLWCMCYGQAQMQEWVGNMGHPWGVGLGSAIMVPLHSCP